MLGNVDIWWANQSTTANRRDASPPGAGWPFVRAVPAPPSRSAAFLTGQDKAMAHPQPWTC